ncbi:hypothetical protein Y032_0025g1130 [Ancylostoma ceylanicum]|uniref:G-protein coupled receptors family 1 profile domain-containing protein n=1 Tax=Ancylostoma ceylanicum TaxID=53326 RepID=A0A016UV68_9BILA|nr:hypothetical protein Y032_0025g1130 [Ancylostoma ceylanicum]
MTRDFAIPGFFDIIGIFVVQYIMIQRKMTCGSKLEFLTRTMYAMSGVTYFTHLIGCFLMTLNRYTAVCSPLSHKKIWSNKTVVAMLVIDIGISIAVHAPLFLIKLVYKFQGDTCKVAGRAVKTPAIRVISSLSTIFYGCLNIIMVARIIYVIVKVYKKTRRYRQELGLVVFVTIDCLLGVIDCIFETADLLHLRNANVIFSWISSNSMNAYSIVLLNKELLIEAIAPVRERLSLMFSSRAAPIVVTPKF